MPWNYKDIVRWAVSRALVGTGEEPCLPSKGNAAQRSLRRVVGQANPPIVEEAGERLPPLQHIIHRLRHIGVARQAGSFTSHPLFQRRRQRRHPDLSNGVSLCCRQPVDLALDIEDSVDPAHRLDRQRCLREIGDDEEFAPAMGPARGFGQRTGFTPRMIKVVEAGIRVRLKNAGVIHQMPERMRSTAVAGVMKDHTGRRQSAEWTVVTHIAPQSAGDGFVLRQNRHRRIVTVNALGGEHVSFDQCHQRRQGARAGANPVGQR
jgi:hypothetical protein